MFYNISLSGEMTRLFNSNNSLIDVIRQGSCRYRKLRNSSIYLARFIISGHRSSATLWF